MTTFISYGKVAHFVNKHLVLDGETIGKFAGLKEAKEYCEAVYMSKLLAEELSSKEKFAITEEKIAFTIAEQAEVKPTTSTVSEFKKLLETKHFAPLNTLLVLREQSRDLSQFPGKVEYVMQDGSTVLLNIETNLKLNRLIDSRESKELISFMTRNSANFVMCVEQLLEDYDAN